MTSSGVTSSSGPAEDLRRRGEEGVATHGAPLGGDVAEAPHAPDAGAVDQLLRPRVALEDAAVAELDDVVADRRRARRRARRPWRESPRDRAAAAAAMAMARPSSRVRKDLGGDAPHLGEALVVVDDARRRCRRRGCRRWSLPASRATATVARAERSAARLRSVRSTLTAVTPAGRPASSNSGVQRVSHEVPNDSVIDGHLFAGERASGERVHLGSEG